MQMRWKCMHFPENARILRKLDENAHIFLKMCAIYANWMEMHAFSENVHIG